MNTTIIVAIVIGYLLGSIPFALVIGKLFYKKDVRDFGSGNLGGTNAGRLLGKKVGIAVIILDLLKVVLAVGIVAYFFSPTASIYAGVAGAFGHCYPIFAGFRGGKAVATMFGFLLSTSIFTFHSPWYFLVPLAVFFVMLVVTKMVSLSALLAAFTSTIYIILKGNSINIVIASILLTLLVTYRHKDNIKRILKGEERKISWLDKKKK